MVLAGHGDGVKTDLWREAGYLGPGTLHEKWYSGTGQIGLVLRLLPIFLLLLVFQSRHRDSAEDTGVAFRSTTAAKGTSVTFSAPSLALDWLDTNNVG
jgi:hypothetical protein